MIDISVSYKQSQHPHWPKTKEHRGRIWILSNFVVFHRKCAKFVTFLRASAKEFRDGTTGGMAGSIRKR